MVGHRAARYYGKIMLSPNRTLYNDALAMYPEAVEAGSDFPDFLYACGKYADHHDAGEEAHWPKWQAAAVRYIRSRDDFQRGNWSSDTARLVAFLFGVSVHYITDEIWEGLNTQWASGQGFVRTLSAFNLGHDGKTDNDEMIANMAGDFGVAFEMAESDIHPWKRYFPVKDIVEIYHLDGFANVTLASISNCRALFDLGLWAEKAFGSVLFLLYTERVKQVPYAAEALIEAPFNGIDDMAIWASFVWERIARWLDQVEEEAKAMNGDDEDDRWTFALFQEMRPYQKHADSLRAIRNPDKIFMFHEQTGGLIMSSEYGNGPLREVLKSMLQSLIDMSLGKDRKVKANVCVYAYVGSGFSVSELLQRSPSDEARPIKEEGTEERRALASENEYNPSKNDEEEASSSSLLSSSSSMLFERYGSSAVEYYGSASTFGDFDSDGIMEIAVAAYGAGVPGEPQKGRVDILAASSLAQDTSSIGGSSATTNFTELVGPEIHGRFGHAVLAMDINMDGVCDLIVGAPESGWNNSLPIHDEEPHVRLWGTIYIFLGRAGEGLRKTADITVRTRQDFTGLGLVLAAGDVNDDGHDDLLMGCPLWSRADGNGIHNGKVFVMLASTKHGSSSSAIDLDIDANVLRLQADGNDKTAAHPGSTSSSSLSSLLFSIEGPSEYAFFGQSLTVVANSSSSTAAVLVVGAPGYRKSQQRSRGAETEANVVGAVFGICIEEKGQKQQQQGLGLTETSAKLEFMIIGDEPLAEFGSARSSRYIDLFVTIMISPTENVEKTVIYPFKTKKARAGVVRFINIAGLKGNISSAELNKKMTILQGSSRFGRFGRHVKIVEATQTEGRDGEDPALLLSAFISAPLENSLVSHESGAVYFAELEFHPAESVSINKASRWSLKGSTSLRHVGSSISVNWASSSASMSSQVAVGASRTSSKSMEMSGYLAAYQLTTDHKVLA
eukprot:jgi/Bigna1/141182/aug1.61_g15890